MTERYNLLQGPVEVADDDEYRPADTYRYVNEVHKDTIAGLMARAERLQTELDATRTRLAAAEAALLTLNEWDMLHLNADGTGWACSDANWARHVIAKGLGESDIIDTNESHRRLTVTYDTTTTTGGGDG